MGHSPPWIHVGLLRSMLVNNCPSCVFTYAVVSVRNRASACERCGDRAVVLIVGIRCRPRCSVGRTGELDEIVVYIVLVRIGRPDRVRCVVFCAALNATIGMVVLVVDGEAERGVTS